MRLIDAMMNSQTRREFLKRCALLAGGGATGLAALSAMGVSLEEAYSLGIGPLLSRRGTGGSGPGAWVNWDEASEDTLDVDQDGDGTEDTYICFFENPANSGNETGRGAGLSGADLVLTQVGSVAGATGDPPTRPFDHSDNRFSIPSAVTDLTGAGNGTGEYTLICKMKDLANHGGANSDYVLYINSTANEDVSREHTAEGLEFGIHGTPTASPGTSGDLYIIYAKPSGGNTWCGWTDSKPNSKSDIDSNNIIEIGSELYLGWTGRYIGAYSDGSQAMGGAGYYILFSNRYLL